MKRESFWETMLWASLIGIGAFCLVHGLLGMFEIV